MEAFHIAVPVGKPSGSGIHKPGTIQLLQIFIPVPAVKLPPAFIKDRPVTHAGVLFQSQNRTFHALPKPPAGLRVPVEVPVTPVLADAKGRKGRVPQEMVGSVIHHILKYHHAQAVAGVVKQLRLYLNMLAQHIEAQLLHGQNVPVKAGGLRRSEQAVAPIALIQNAVEKVRLSVQA